MSSGARSRKAVATPELQASALNNVERLIFAQAVHEFGANAWQEVSKLLSQHPLVSQPKGTFTPQSCSVLHHNLMDEAGLEWSEEDVAPKSQRHLRLAQRFYVARVTELRSLIADEEAEFKKIASEIDEIRSGAWDRKILASMGVVKESVSGDALVQDATAAAVVEPDSEPPSQAVDDAGKSIEEEAEEVERGQDSLNSEEGNAIEQLDADQSAIAPVVLTKEPEALIVTEHEEKEERSDNDAVNELIDDFGSDRPPEALEREETTPTPKATSPAPAADDMQVDDETIKGEGDDDDMRPEPLPAASPQADAVSPEESPHTPDEVDEDSEGRQGRAEGKRKALDEDTTMLDARDKKRLREESKSADDESIDGDEEFQRDIFLMFANAMMYNRPGSEIYNMAEEMMVSSERDINAFRQTEGFHRM
ncbi:uncharacterized protein BXZ73DRAFT_97479 [Epithele typhae]|uniref:uncharacterized protein n=1 Tax=Epithele typhae TaxID=378194 RepID=UPI0020088B8C|nr:uncharacterized protein BXZ73DRAFT_97479 [Epithele typhae]KAH9943439.1 hypothetical protein BXZ73DRAFT_97479 [Epithele typhae]